MTAVLNGLRRHHRLLLVLVTAQLTTSALPLIRWFTYGADIRESWLSSIWRNYSSVLVMFWLWMVAIVVMGIGAWWSREVDDGFYLEVWRHRSYRAWLAERIRFGALMVLVVLGIGMAPPLAASHSGQGGEVLVVTALLVLYVAGLSLSVVALSLAGVRTSLAVTVVLLFHLTNVIFDGLGLPNVVTFYLLAEDASVLSAAGGVGVLIVATAVVLLMSTPERLMRRGSDAR